MINKVLIKDVTRQENNVHIAVYPFPHAYIVMQMHKGDKFEEDIFGCLEELWKRELSNMLWDEIPGLDTLFFANGKVTIHHNGLLDDSEVIEIATEIIKPYLETQLKLMMLEKQG